MPDVAPAAGRLISDDTWGILCVYAEARGEPYEGMVGVSNVIRTRTKKKFFSDGTFAGTVCAPHQFSWMNTSDGQRSRVLKAKREDLAMNDCTRAWFEGEFNVVVGECVYYHSVAVSPWWAKATGIRFVKRIGRHLFYAEED